MKVQPIMLINCIFIIILNINNDTSMNIMKVIINDNWKNIINEFVEIEKQKAVLDKMGDGLYQGYLFSKPLKEDVCVRYIRNNI